MGCRPPPGRFQGPCFPSALPLQGCALLTTQESALTQSICASLQRRISSGTVGAQLAGEEAHGKTCLVSLRSRQLRKSSRTTESLTLQSHAAPGGFYLPANKRKKPWKISCQLQHLAVASWLFQRTRIFQRVPV